MKISYCKYSLELKHQFTIAYSSRRTTPVVLIKIEHGGFTGYGEASLPPYLHETQETVIAFMQKVAQLKLNEISNINSLLKVVDKIALNNTAAKAAVDIALHDLQGEINYKPSYKLFGIEPIVLPITSFTIGIDEPEIMVQKIHEAEPYKILKIKLGTDRDKNIIGMIREVTDKPLYVDINQGWSDTQFALDMAKWLYEQKVLLIEQPFKKEDLKSSSWLAARSPIPIIADEAVQRLDDLETIKNAYNGINIKLMKYTGMKEASEMILRARVLDLKVMFGCMTETSCAISAALQLVGLVDYADLDGNLLITNDPFETDNLNNGQLKLSDKHGLGIELKKDIDFIALDEISLRDWV